MMPGEPGRFADPPLPDAPPERPGARDTWPLATWELHETIAVALAPLGVALFTTIVLIAFGARGGALVFAVSAVQQVALGLGIWWWVRIHTGSSAGLGLRREPGVGGDVGAGLIAGIAALVATTALVGLLRAITGSEPPASPLGATGAAWEIPNALLALVTAPVCEEIAFRGFLFGGLRRRFRFVGAAAISAAVFAVIHGQPFTMPALFAAGLIQAAVYERRRSLVAPMVAHAFVNLVAVSAFFALRG
jgi:membrane protease YdiL (CAAX protease family)